MMDKMLEAILDQVVTIERWRRRRSYLYHFRNWRILELLPMGDRGSFLCVRRICFEV